MCGAARRRLTPALTRHDDRQLLDGTCNGNAGRVGRRPPRHHRDLRITAPQFQPGPDPPHIERVHLRERRFKTLKRLAGDGTLEGRAFGVRHLVVEFGAQGTPGLPANVVVHEVDDGLVQVGPQRAFAAVLEVLKGETLKEQVTEWAEELADEVVGRCVDKDRHPTEWDWNALREGMNHLFNMRPEFAADQIELATEEQLAELHLRLKGV